MIQIRSPPLTAVAFNWAKAVITLDSTTISVLSTVNHGWLSGTQVEWYF